MGLYVQILIFVTIGVVLLWFGYSLFFGRLAGIHLEGQDRARRKQPERGSSGDPGEPQVCPVCSARLNKGELVKSMAFPSLTGGKDRFKHIRCCFYCLDGNRRRTCPVCGAYLNDDEILIARMFERSRRRSHVHVLGCSRCRKAGGMR